VEVDRIGSDVGHDPANLLHCAAERGESAFRSPRDEAFGWDDLEPRRHAHGDVVTCGDLPGDDRPEHRGDASGRDLGDVQDAHGPSFADLVCLP